MRCYNERATDRAPDDYQRSSRPLARLATFITEDMPHWWQSSDSAAVVKRIGVWVGIPLILTFIACVVAEAAYEKYGDGLSPTAEAWRYGLFGHWIAFVLSAALICIGGLTCILAGPRVGWNYYDSDREFWMQGLLCLGGAALAVFGLGAVLGSAEWTLRAAERLRYGAPLPSVQEVLTSRDGIQALTRLGQKDSAGLITKLELSVDSPAALATMTHLRLEYRLQDLSLRGNKYGNYHLSDSDFEVISLYRSLRRLTLSGLTQLTDVGLEHLQSLPNLVELTISHCPGIQGKSLSKLRGLRKLELRHVTLDDDTVRSLPRSLYRLALRNCNGYSRDAIKAFASKANCTCYLDESVVYSGR